MRTDACLPQCTTGTHPHTHALTHPARSLDYEEFFAAVTNSGINFSEDQVDPAPAHAPAHARSHARVCACACAYEGAHMRVRVRARANLSAR